MLPSLKKSLFSNLEIVESYLRVASLYPMIADSYYTAGNQKIDFRDELRQDDRPDFSK